MPNTVPNRSPAFHREEPIAEVERRAVALWPRIANDVGLPVENVAFNMMLVNSSRRDRRAVIGVKTEDGQKFVLRTEFATINIKGHMGNLEQHRKAARALCDVSGVNVPNILWQDEVYPYALFEFAPGETAQRELTFADYGLTDRARLLRRIGCAVRALHEHGAVSEQRFWPKAQLRDVEESAARLRAGDIEVHKPKRFLGLCAMLHRFARSARGEIFHKVAQHGDLHFRNILVTEDLVSFVDFSRSGAASRHVDLVKLWQAKMPENLVQLGRKQDFGCVAAADWQAFEEGYGRDLTNDPVFQFTFLFRLYLIWRKLPPLGEPRKESEIEASLGADRIFSWFLEHHPS